MPGGSCGQGGREAGTGLDVPEVDIAGHLRQGIIPVHADVETALFALGKAPPEVAEPDERVDSVRVLRGARGGVAITVRVV